MKYFSEKPPDKYEPRWWHSVLQTLEVVINRNATPAEPEITVVEEIFEAVTVVGTAYSGTVNIDCGASPVHLNTATATGNLTLNFRQSSTETLSSKLGVGEAITMSVILTCGATAYYPSAVQIDGTAVTPKWLGGTAPAAGHASSIDSYTFTLIKTADTPAYTVLASQTKYA